MMRILRQIVLPVGLIAGLLMPAPASAQGGRGSEGRRGDSDWNRSGRVDRGDNWRRDRSDRWRRELCTVEVRKCRKRVVWIDERGRKITRPGRCWTERETFRC